LGTVPRYIFELNRQQDSYLHMSWVEFIDRKRRSFSVMQVEPAFDIRQSKTMAIWRMCTGWIQSYTAVRDAHLYPRSLPSHINRKLAM